MPNSLPNLAFSTALLAQELAHLSCLQPHPCLAHLHIHCYLLLPTPSSLHMVQHAARSTFLLLHVPVWHPSLASPMTCWGGRPPFPHLHALTGLSQILYLPHVTCEIMAPGQGLCLHLLNSLNNRHPEKFISKGLIIQLSPIF